MPRLAQRDLPPGLVIRPIEGQAPQRHLFVAIPKGAQDSPLIKVLTLLETANSERRGLT